MAVETWVSALEGLGACSAGARLSEFIPISKASFRALAFGAFLCAVLDLP